MAFILSHVIYVGMWQLVAEPGAATEAGFGGGAGKRVRRTYKPVSACLFARPPATALGFGAKAMCALSGPHSSPLAGCKRTLASRNWNKGSLSYVCECVHVCVSVYKCVCESVSVCAYDKLI